MKRTALTRKTPMKSGSWPHIDRKEAAAVAKVRRSLKSSQRTVTSAERSFWDRLSALGCIACRIDGILNTHVSIHHIDGRTKPGCHRLVLPLCAPHHQHDDTDPAGRIGVHPYKAQFEARYGAQLDLLDQCMVLLGEEVAEL
ncbi:Ref family recombination enhancement nuclease [Massilia sp. TS11]|uniref:Ref family recombination enhancement nuclease n=1 Tax=Massilia sp. TS11 TaxID=2908003 RepID=UPI001EDB5987|nr:Ref family recombination enhancement nuclease [Massilia sp. TS11]MCG2586517.1 Ref family protein [Massilia sp. TS11]